MLIWEDVPKKWLRIPADLGCGQLFARPMLRSPCGWEGPVVGQK